MALLKNTLVWIKSGFAGGRAGTRRLRWAKLDSGRLRSMSRMCSVLMVGQTLEISNSDTVNHNIHADAKVNPGWNVTETAASPKKRTERFEKERKFCSRSPAASTRGCEVIWPWSATHSSPSPARDGSYSLKGRSSRHPIRLEAVHEKIWKKKRKCKS